jgi:hypothetical protein
MGLQDRCLLTRDQPRDGSVSNAPGFKHACLDEDNTDGSATLKYALDEATGAERLVVGV